MSYPTNVAAPTSPPAKTEYEEPPNKMSRGGHDADALELRFLIPSKAAGAIIGKGGENINHLREQYSAKVHIPDSHGPERVLHLSGTLQSLLEIMNETIPRLEGSQLPSGDSDIRLLVHQSHVGSIIGKGGSKIQELRQKSNLKTLKVYSNPCPNSTARVVQFIGQTNEILETVNTIILRLEVEQVKGAVQAYDARCFSDGDPAAYGGWGLIPEADRGPRGDGMGGAPRRGGAGGFRGGARGGYRNQGNNNYAPDPMGGMGHSGPPKVPHAPMAGGFNFGTPDIITTQVSIPNHLIGSIMGKGGQRINQIREESDAEIKISGPDPEIEDRIITITGTNDQIQNAQYLLQMCVKKYSGHYDK